MNRKMIRSGDIDTMVKISVIMPVYNSEQYLKDTIDSVLEQDMDSFELILVDDGSVDSSGDICDDYARRDNRVVVAHKKNGGICSARNYGLKIARGEYIAFCDNDDRYLQGLLRENYNLAKIHGADVVRFCRKNVKTYKGKLISELATGGFAFCVVPAEELSNHYPAIRNTGAGPWAGIYRKDFLIKHRISFDERMRYGYEDLMFNLQCYAVAKKIIANPKVYYLWLQRIEHSTTGKYNKNVLTSLMHCAVFEQILFRKKKIEEGTPGYWSYLLTNYYIADIYNRIRPETENLTNNERINILGHFRRSAKIDYRLTPAGIQWHLKKAPLSLIARFLFQGHMYWSVYILFNLYRDVNSCLLKRKIKRL